MHYFIANHVKRIYHSSKLIHHALVNKCNLQSNRRPNDDLKKT